MKRVLLVLLATTAGCLGPQQDPSAYFLLSPASPPGANQPVPVVLGLGPITIPGYLDRPQIVVRVSENEVALSEADRWAEPLEGHLTRTLQENLSRLLPGSSYVGYPWYESEAPHYGVTLDIRRFESDSAGAVVLEGTWRLSEGATLVDSRPIRVDETATAPGRAAAVAAQSRALATLSTEIATSVRRAWAARRP